MFSPLHGPAAYYYYYHQCRNIILKYFNVYRWLLNKEEGDGSTEIELIPEESDPKEDGQSSPGDKKGTKGGKR